MSEPSSNLPAQTGSVVLAQSPLPDEDRVALQEAVKALEHTNLATRLATAIGRQLGTLGRFLPPGVSGLVNRSAEAAVRSAMTVALGSLGTKRPRDRRWFHKSLAALTGAAGGAFGLTSLPIELPLSTVLLLRSIADIARNEGEDLNDPEVALACLQVFALGAHEKGDDFTDSGYYAVRGLMAKTVSEASRYVLVQGLGDEAAPVLVRLVAQIGSRFGLVVSEKLAAQAVPIVGAAGGAVVNYAFAEHFQALAFGHFTVRRLERRYGGDVIRAEYDRLLGNSRSASFA